MSELRAAVEPAVRGWWQEVLASGGLPRGAVPVRSRLVRHVGRIDLPAGAVFVKVMAFPRWHDRVRYLLRPLPAAREAAMLAAVARAGVSCPQVLAVRTARRFLLPWRSLLVLAALHAKVDEASADTALRERARLARQLGEAGLYHPDLNPDNFLRLHDGRLAVLDVQSMRRTPCRRAAARAMAARLLLEASGLSPARALAVLAEVGLVRGDAGLEAMAVRQAHRWLRQRIRRCVRTSTEFVRLRAPGLQVEHRRRGELPPGRWHRGGRELDRCWFGQRLLEVFAGRAPQLPAFRRGWAWLPGARSVYIPAAIAEERVQDELRILTDAYLEFGWLLRGRPAPDLTALQRWRTRGGTRIVDERGPAWQ